MIIDEIKKLKDNMPDLQIKEVSFNMEKVYVINIQTVSSSILTNQYVMDYLANRSLFNKSSFSLKKDIIYHIPSISFISVSKDNYLDYLFNGFSLIVYKNEMIVFETKATLDRGVSEPSSEPAVKGPKDAFNENYNTNVGLIRKRIKSKNLILKEFVLGSETKTKTALFYMENKVDKKLLNDVICKINSISSDKVLDTYYIKDLIKNENKSSFPTIRSSEKPDLICKSIIDGKICIMCENSNNVLIIPTYFLDYFFYDEDNYQKSMFVVFVKIIRILALFTTIFLPGIYLSLITYDQGMLPTSLLINFATQRASVPFPALIEVILLLLAFEFLYDGDELTPNSRGTSLSILGALVLGDAAVSAGIVSPISVIVVAISAISSIFFVYFDFQSFVRIYRYLVMGLSCLFGIIGVLFGFIIVVTKLCSLKSFGKPFMIGISTFIKTKNKSLKVISASKEES